ncbi:MAG: polynucleotide adenylyltransferase PcnB [Xanthomonadales bacterium]|nr:Poly(A) polymerase I [Xanthomonadales bacterium]MCC6593481.1 polynucleotide adenylyltransferase PcnB [Xanthomonadales bacterium]MCE7929896.1 polynucleotide adenylyltransferase PcnB [Xanthomonadales bacterium PRO6]
MDIDSINHAADGGERLPLLLHRAAHTISRKRISPAAVRVLYGLHEAGWQAHLVGGAVRDLLLGGAPKDYDVATDAHPEDIRGAFRSCRLIGRRFVIAHVRYGQEIIEVTTFRGGNELSAEDEHPDREVEAEGLILRDNVFGTIEEDARRRDFTVNALYYSIDDFAVRDYVGGLSDLAERKLRLIGDPETRYREDPVRMLRAARLAAKLGFTMDRATEEPIGRLAGLLDAIPPARLFDELQKLFLLGHAEKSYDQLLRLRLFEHLFPGVSIDADSGRPYADALIRAALRSTDARVAEGKPVTPAFLFAAFLWEPLQMECAHIDVNAEGALGLAADAVFREAVERVALPKRFSLVTREIWELQPRFATHSPGRAKRLLRHPRFRAAFDFLVLRAAVDPELVEQAKRWEMAQTVADDGFDALFRAVPQTAASRAVGAVVCDGEARPAAKRRRRRRRKPAIAPSE